MLKNGCKNARPQRRLGNFSSVQNWNCPSKRRVDGSLAKTLQPIQKSIVINLLVVQFRPQIAWVNQLGNNLFYPHTMKANCTEWFKINLTLFRSRISHKWENIMNLFLRYLQTVIPWEDLVKVSSKLMVKKWNGSLFLTNSQKPFYTHVNSMETCRRYCILL